MSAATNSSTASADSSVSVSRETSDNADASCAATITREQPSGRGSPATAYTRSANIRSMPVSSASFALSSSRVMVPISILSIFEIGTHLPPEAFICSTMAASSPSRRPPVVVRS